MIGAYYGNPCRIAKEECAHCLRMTSAQKEEVELAASISGISVSQWVIENLLSCARDTIARNNHTVLAPEDFDAFVDALDAPMNPTLKAFVSQKTIWEEQ